MEKTPTWLKVLLIIITIPTAGGALLYAYSHLVDYSPQLNTPVTVGLLVLSALTVIGFIAHVLLSD